MTFRVGDDSVSWSTRHVLVDFLLMWPRGDSKVVRFFSKKITNRIEICFESFAISICWFVIAEMVQSAIICKPQIVLLLERLCYTITSAFPGWTNCGRLNPKQTCTFLFRKLFNSWYNVELLIKREAFTVHGGILQRLLHSFECLFSFFVGLFVRRFKRVDISECWLLLHNNMRGFFVVIANA